MSTIIVTPAKSATDAINSVVTSLKSLEVSYAVMVASAQTEGKKNLLSTSQQSLKTVTSMRTTLENYQLKYGDAYFIVAVTGKTFASTGKYQGAQTAVDAAIKATGKMSNDLVITVYGNPEHTGTPIYTAKYQNGKIVAV